MPVRVLIVEQADTTRDSYVATLQAAGMDVYSAQSVPEAAELIAKRGAQIVVLDLLLMSGNAFFLWVAYWAPCLTSGSLQLRQVAR